MGFLRDFKKGLSAFFMGWAFIRTNGLTHYLLYPLLITLLLWLGGITLMTDILAYLKDLTHQYLQLPVQEVNVDASLWQSAWETLKSWMNSGSSTLVAIVVGFVFFILMLLTTKYVMLALLSPALALISERSEEILLGNSYAFNVGRFLKDVGRGVLISLRNMLIETSLLLLIWVLSLLVPIILPVTAVLSLVITSYFYGYSMIDYVHERKQISIHDGAKKIRQKKGVAVGLGICLALSIQLPLIGFILAGTASLMAAVAAVSLEQDAKEQTNI